MILLFGMQFFNVARALPETDKERKKLPRAYICNVIYTQVGKPFYDWVQKQVDARHKKVTDERNMNIELDPEIAAIFKASTAVSGKFFLLHILYLYLT